MATVSDAPFDIPAFLSGAFDFTRYLTFKVKNAHMTTILCERRIRARGRALFTYSTRAAPHAGTATYQRLRNVSEPHLVSSTNYMRESWFTNSSSVHTFGGISHFSGDDDNSAAVQSADSLSVQSRHNIEGGHSQTRNSTRMSIEQSDSKTERDSLYSTDSADQDTHPLLLSMPVIPHIKLDRKATIREPDFRFAGDLTQNGSFLSPLIRDLRTPTRTSSRRYGRVLAQDDIHQIVCDSYSTEKDALGFQADRRLRMIDNADVANRSSGCSCTHHSTSEPVLNRLFISDDETGLLLNNDTDESFHSDLLSSLIDEANSSFGLHSDSPGTGIDHLLELKQPELKPYTVHAEPSHRQTSLVHSISLNNIIQTVAGGCASLDQLLRKPKTKLKVTTEAISNEAILDAHDPTSKWAPRDGQMIIKVFVASTADIWMVRVPQDISLTNFRSKVITKLGFSVSFSGSVLDEPKRYFTTDEQFKAWVSTRVRFGRNHPIVAHVSRP